MSETIHLGISTCPNDTFAFHGLMEKKVDLRGLEFHVELLDVEQLNQRLLVGDFDVAKASFHAALLLAEETVVLPTGAAIGFGLGPLLLAAKPGTNPKNQFLRKGQEERPVQVLCPGGHTTATLLYRMFHPGEGQIEQVVFSEIMPALEQGRADFGVCIHEGRFTWRESGLACVEDLGTVWETATGAPLPLGGILARRRLAEPTRRKVVLVIRDSIRYGLAHRKETLPTMRASAQSISEKVLFSHVDLYVNSWTIDLGREGREALYLFSKKAAEAGVSHCPLTIDE